MQSLSKFLYNTLPSSQRVSKFGENSYQSIGEMTIIIPTHGQTITITASINALDIPLLLVLDRMVECELDVSPS
jgi:hypothetical protein